MYHHETWLKWKAHETAILAWFLRNSSKIADFLLKVIQSWTFASAQLLNKSYVNGMNLRQQNLSLRSCKPLELLIYFGQGFISFCTNIIGSVQLYWLEMEPLLNKYY